MDWDVIQKHLEQGNFNTELPPEFANIEGSNAVVVYTEVAAMRVELESARQEAERLRGELKAEREGRAADQSEIRKMEREIGKLEGRIEMLMEMLRDGK
jgi:chromosome segregation ATPase